MTKDLVEEKGSWPNNFNLGLNSLRYAKTIPSSAVTNLPPIPLSYLPISIPKGNALLNFLCAYKHMQRSVLISIFLQQICALCALNPPLPH